VDSAPLGPRCFRPLHVESPRARAGDGLRLREPEGPWARDRGQVPTPPVYGVPSLHPSGLSLHLRIMGALAFSLLPGLVAGVEGGPRAPGVVLGGAADSVWAGGVARVAVVTGAFLFWDLCEVRSPGNNPRSQAAPRRAPSPDASRKFLFLFLAGGGRQSKGQRGVGSLDRNELQN
jgi:hypothetical protein